MEYLIILVILLILMLRLLGEKK